MPLFEYVDANGHRTELLRKTVDRDQPVYCEECGEEMRLVVSVASVPPDGALSYKAR